MSSLAEITSRSDLVVRGTITDLYLRRPGTRFQPAYAEVSITEVLKGEPVSRAPGTVEVEIAYEAEAEDLPSSLPAHDHLWFLIHESAFDPDNPMAINGLTYFTTDYVQVSVLRDIGGVVEVILPDAIAIAFSQEHFPVPLDGTSFEELLDRVRDLAEGPSAATQLLATWAPPTEPDPNRFFAC